MAPLDPTSDPRRLLRKLYAGVDGFEISRRDERLVNRSKASPTYGELMPTATLRLIAELGLRRGDVFYDLGAGVGKVAMLAAMTTPARAIGLELSRERVERGAPVLAEARRRRLPGARRVELRHGDMMTADIDDATVIYTCSTAFSTAFMNRLARRLAALPRLRTVASLQDFDVHRGFELVEIHRLDASWKRRTKVHVYARRR